MKAVASRNRFRTFNVSNEEFLFDTETSLLLRSDGGCRREAAGVVDRYFPQLAQPNMPSESPTGDQNCLRPARCTLVVTNACNFRCRYCVYSENRYAHYRTHNSAQLRSELALSFINACVERWNSRPLVIDFFGGEPLLRFQLIKFLVQEIEGIRRVGSIQFALTTNGLLLSPEVCDFLVEHEIGLCVSLDGPIDVHDRNRVLRNGCPTFERVWSNVCRLRASHPDFFEHRVNFMATVEDSEDLLRVLDMFDRNGLCKSQFRAVKPDVSKDECNVPVLSGAARLLTSKFLEACLENHSGRMNLYGADLADFCKMFDRRTVFPPGNTAAMAAGFCLPYADSAVLQTDATVSFCNIVEYHRLGRMRGGKIEVDLGAMARMTEEFDRFYNYHCMHCWVRTICQLCWVHFLDVDHKPSDKKLLSNCSQHRRRADDYIREYIALKLSNPLVFHNMEHGQSVVNRI